MCPFRSNALGIGLPVGYPLELAGGRVDPAPALLEVDDAREWLEDPGGGSIPELLTNRTRRRSTAWKGNKTRMLLQGGRGRERRFEVGLLGKERALEGPARDHAPRLSRPCQCMASECRRIPAVHFRGCRPVEGWVVSCSVVGSMVVENQGRSSGDEVESEGLSALRPASVVAGGEMDV